MKKPVFTGAAVAIITPMNADGSVNFEELGCIIDDQIAHGTDAIVICGTTGESPTLSDEEHTACIRYAVNDKTDLLNLCSRTFINVDVDADAVAFDRRHSDFDICGVTATREILAS